MKNWSIWDAIFWATFWGISAAAVVFPVIWPLTRLDWGGRRVL